MESSFSASSESPSCCFVCPQVQSSGVPSHTSSWTFRSVRCLRSSPAVPWLRWTATWTPQVEIASVWDSWATSTVLLPATGPGDRSDPFLPVQTSLDQTDPFKPVHPAGGAATRQCCHLSRRSADSTSVGGFSWNVEVRGTSGCVALATTLCLFRVTTWTGRRAEHQVMVFIRSTPAHTSRWASPCCESLSELPVLYLNLLNASCTPVLS